MSLGPDEPLLHCVLGRLGTTLCGGRYRISYVIGVGGMAAVYGGVHRNGLEVAIKVLHDGLASRHDIERLRREARLANSIRHPGVVRFTDDDVAENGTIFLVMDLLEGQTVQDRAARGGKKLPLEEVVFIAHELLDVLRATHAEGIAHRDIKPGNLFITREGQLRVLDFGVACFFEAPRAACAASARRTGRATGTPAFMAPEQALGRVQDVDGRTDLWAVGATMFSLLSGQSVHEGGSASEILARARTERARSLRDVAADLPEALCDVVDRALAFEKSERWPDARAMDDALLRACEPLVGAPLSKLVFPVSRPTPLADIHDVSTERTPPTQSLTPVAESASPPSQTFDAPRRLGRWLASGMAAAAVAGVLGFTLVRGANVEALVTASHKAWLDGNVEQARTRAQSALAANGSSAGAHLALVRAGPVWPSEIDRVHFVKAQEERDTLTAAERRYLDALAPAMTVPSDFRLSSDRLEALHREDPTDLDRRIALAIGWIRTGRIDDAIASLQPLADAPDARGIVLAALGLAQTMRDDIDGARATYRRCVTSFPAASSCTSRFTELELLEGHCTEAERIARQHMEAHPRDPNVRLYLAYALAARSAPVREIRAMLYQWADLQDRSKGNLHRLRAELTMALYEGHFREAQSIYERLAIELAALDSDEERVVHTVDGMFLNAELGLGSEAERIISTYTDERHGLRRHSYRGDNVLYIRAYATRLGLLPWEQWAPLRDESLAQHQDRDDLADGLQRNWLDAYATPVTTAAGAREALDALPRYLPLLPRISRWFQHDAVIGAVFWMGGRPHEAMAHFERAAASCTHLDGPIPYAHMLLNFGAMLEEQGDIPRACGMYRRLLERFPASSGSRSAAQAAIREAAVCQSNTSGDRW